MSRKWTDADLAKLDFGLGDREQSIIALSKMTEEEQSAWTESVQKQLIDNVIAFEETRAHEMKNAYENSNE